MTVIKRKKNNNKQSACVCGKKTKLFVRITKEDEAIEVLTKAAGVLENTELGSEEHKAALLEILNAFEGELELSVYTLRRENSQNWTDSDNLYLSSVEVLNFVKRLLD